MARGEIEYLPADRNDFNTLQSLVDAEGGRFVVKEGTITLRGDSNFSVQVYASDYTGIGGLFQRILDFFKQLFESNDVEFVALKFLSVLGKREIEQLLIDPTDPTGQRLGKIDALGEFILQKARESRNTDAIEFAEAALAKIRALRQDKSAVEKFLITDETSPVVRVMKKATNEGANISLAVKAALTDHIRAVTHQISPTEQPGHFLFVLERGLDEIDLATDNAAHQIRALSDVARIKRLNDAYVDVLAINNLLPAGRTPFGFLIDSNQLTKKLDHSLVKQDVDVLHALRGRIEAYAREKGRITNTPEFVYAVLYGIEDVDFSDAGAAEKISKNGGVKVLAGIDAYRNHQKSIDLFGIMAVERDDFRPEYSFVDGKMRFTENQLRSIENLGGIIFDIEQVTDTTVHESPELFKELFRGANVTADQFERGLEVTTLRRELLAPATIQSAKSKCQFLSNAKRLISQLDLSTTAGRVIHELQRNSIGTTHAAEQARNHLIEVGQLVKALEEKVANISTQPNLVSFVLRHTIPTTDLSNVNLSANLALACANMDELIGKYRNEEAILSLAELATDFIISNKITAAKSLIATNTVIENNIQVFGEVVRELTSRGIPADKILYILDVATERKPLDRALPSSFKAQVTEGAYVAEKIEEFNSLVRLSNFAALAPDSIVARAIAVADPSDTLVENMHLVSARIKQLEELGFTANLGAGLDRRFTMTLEREAGISPEFGKLFFIFLVTYGLGDSLDALQSTRKEEFLFRSDLDFNEAFFEFMRQHTPRVYRSGKKCAQEAANEDNERKHGLIASTLFLPLGFLYTADAGDYRRRGAPTGIQRLTPSFFTRAVSFLNGEAIQRLQEERAARELEEIRQREEAAAAARAARIEATRYNGEFRRLRTGLRDHIIPNVIQLVRGEVEKMKAAGQRIISPDLLMGLLELHATRALETYAISEGIRVTTFRDFVDNKKERDFNPILLRALSELVPIEVKAKAEEAPADRQGKIASALSAFGSAVAGLLSAPEE